MNERMLWRAMLLNWSLTLDAHPFGSHHPEQGNAQYEYKQSRNFSAKSISYPNCPLIYWTISYGNVDDTSDSLWHISTNIPQVWYDHG
jgi:hypothetical protein